MPHVVEDYSQVVERRLLFMKQHLPKGIGVTADRSWLTGGNFSQYRFYREGQLEPTIATMWLDLTIILVKSREIPAWLYNLAHYLESKYLVDREIGIFTK